MKKTEAIAQFLSEPNTLGRTSPLADQYNYNMEVQVNVARGEGEVVGGVTGFGKGWRGYTDGVEVWKHFRIPYAANTEPRYTDGNLNFDLAKHAEAIGCTGWDWVERRAIWVGFDFDSIVGHKAGLSEGELDGILDRVKSIDWVSIYTSTSGNGFHLYVHVTDSPELKTHTDHAAFSRAILHRLGTLADINLSEKVDVCGGVLWLWKRGAVGYDCIKPATINLQGNQIPDWKEHLTVVKSNGRAGRRTVFSGLDFDRLSNACRRISLDDDHRKLIKWLDQNQCLHWFDTDHHMLVCHTAALKEAPHEGLFDTIAQGTSKDDQNCFGFPLSNGAWVIRRHTPGCNEHPLWRTDKSGWTYCYYNRVPDFDTVCNLYGVEGSKSTYYFKRLPDLCRALGCLSIEIEFESAYQNRRGTIQQIERGKLLVAWERYDQDPDQEGWNATKKTWEKIFRVQTPTTDSFPADHLVRHVVSAGRDAGWFAKTRDEWIAQPKSNIQDVLLSQGIKRTTLSHVLGESILQHWELVNLPFKPEYPGNRQWNRNAAQLAFDPQPGEHPHWNLVLEHVGLNLLTEENEWCQTNGVNSGQDYIILWIASLLLNPLEPLPYLFLYGPQNSGKSILHEAIRILFKTGRGCTRADTALTSPQNYNGELEGSVLCVVEEVNLRKSKQAYEKIKDWVTSRHITIHHKYQTPYDLANSTHWIQCANDPQFCPIFTGDSRIVVLDIPPLETQIPKPKLLNSLKEEGPAFLFTLLNTEIPESPERLRIPVISTGEKELQAELNRSLLEQFIDATVHKCAGHKIAFSEFCEKFWREIPPTEKAYWSRRKISISLPHTIIRGKTGQYNEICLGNVTWNKEARANGRYIRNKDRLKLVKGEG